MAQPAICLAQPAIWWVGGFQDYTVSSLGQVIVKKYNEIHNKISEMKKPTRFNIRFSEYNSCLFFGYFYLKTREAFKKLSSIENCSKRGENKKFFKITMTTIGF